MLDDYKLTRGSALRIPNESWFQENVSPASSYQYASFFSFPWKKTQPKLSLITMFPNVLIDEGWYYKLTSCSVGLDSRVTDGRTTCYVYFGRWTIWPSAKQGCCSKGSQKWAKPAGSGQPVLSVPPQGQRVLRAAYWNLSSVSLRISAPSLTYFYPQKVAFWVAVPLFKSHLFKKELTKI